MIEIRVLSYLHQNLLLTPILTYPAGLKSDLCLSLNLDSFFVYARNKESSTAHQFDKKAY